MPEFDEVIIREEDCLLRIRLTRMGAKKRPFYRVVVTERRQARDGRFVEVVGRYNPKDNPPLIEFDMERVTHWLQHGAQPSETVHSLLKRAARDGRTGSCSGRRGRETVAIKQSRATGSATYERAAVEGLRSNGKRKDPAH